MAVGVTHVNNEHPQNELSASRDLALECYHRITLTFLLRLLIRLKLKFELDVFCVINVNVPQKTVR